MTTHEAEMVTPRRKEGMVAETYNEFVTLREDLLEHHDYEAVLPDIWYLLVAWYGCATR